MTLALQGRIDSNNAAQTEEAILRQLAENAPAAVTLDAEELEYISSAGLRMILHLKHTCPELRIVNVRSEVYEIFEMTGFTEMMPVEKSYRVVSVEGCEVISEGFNGKVYRIDQDNVVKVYKNADNSVRNTSKPLQHNAFRKIVVLTTCSKEKALKSLRFQGFFTF